jgi:protein gp37
MYRGMARWGHDPKTVVRAAKPTFRKPYKIQREIDEGLRPNLIDRLMFTCSWSDFFNPEADPWRPEAWQIIRECPDVIPQILTKLPHRITDHLPPFWDEIKGRCWMGVSVENQPAAWRIKYLIEVDAAVRFLSCEPLIGPVDVLQAIAESPVTKAGDLASDWIHWVIVGGESGPGARIMKIDHARALVHQCQNAGIAVLMKQLGGIAAKELGLVDYKGENMAEWPDEISDLKVHAFPESAYA